jgi:hypothetical protein
VFFGENLFLDMIKLIERKKIDGNEIKKLYNEFFTSVAKMLMQSGRRLMRD